MCAHDVSLGPQCYLTIHQNMVYKTDLFVLVGCETWPLQQGWVHDHMSMILSI